MPRQDQEAIAVHAKQLLEDELLSSALDSIENEIIAKLKAANIDGSDESARFVLELSRKLQTAEAFKRSLRGKITAHSISEYNKRGKV